MTRERGPKWTTFEELLEGKTPVTFINEPIDYAVDFAVEEPKRESATARAMRRWFKQDPAVENEPAG
jgi:hypothetical protein